MSKGKPGLFSARILFFDGFSFFDAAYQELAH
jgi:hypothetical protein